MSRYALLRSTVHLFLVAAFEGYSVSSPPAHSMRQDGLMQQWETSSLSDRKPNMRRAVAKSCWAIVLTCYSEYKLWNLGDPLPITTVQKKNNLLVQLCVRSEWCKFPRLVQSQIVR